MIRLDPDAMPPKELERLKADGYGDLIAKPLDGLAENALLRRTMQAVHDNAASHHAGEDGKARALYVIANWTAAALAGRLHPDVERITKGVVADV